LLALRLEVLIPAEIAARLFASRGDAPVSAPLFASVRRPGQPLTERAVNYIVKEAAECAGVNPAASVHWLRHAHASHAIDNGAPIMLVSATLGHADLKTKSVCAHARPGETPKFMNRATVVRSRKQTLRWLAPREQSPETRTATSSRIRSL